MLNDFQDSIAKRLEANGMSPSAAKLVAQGITGLTIAGVGAAVGGGQWATYGAAVDFNNRQLHPTEIQVIKQNAERYAKQLYKTDKPTADQIEGATTMLVNTAQNVLDNNMGTVVPFSKDADNFLQTLKIEYQKSNGTLQLPGTAGEQQLFYATVEQKNQPWLNQGLGDPKITGLIVKTPINPAVNNPTSDPTRDRVTGLPLDDKGRYQRQVSIDGENFAPKYFQCATADCVVGGQNLDKSDPGTQAFLKASDKKVFDDINKAATVVAIVSPVGPAGVIAAYVGPISSVASGIVDDQPLNALFKEGLQATAGAYLQKVYGLPQAVVIRITSLIDLAGGWQAFVVRTREEASKGKK